MSEEKPRTEKTATEITSTETAPITPASEQATSFLSDPVTTEPKLSDAERIKQEAEMEEMLTQSFIKSILTTERERVCAILSACNNMERYDLAHDLIDKGLTVEEASHKILNAMVSIGDESQITTNLTPYPNASDENPLIQNAKARAESAVA